MLVLKGLPKRKAELVTVLDAIHSVPGLTSSEIQKMFEGSVSPILNYLGMELFIEKRDGGLYPVGDHR